MSTDPFLYFPQSVGAPARDAVTITPSDGTELAKIPQALMIGVAGNLSFETMEGTVINAYPVEKGPFPIRVRRVLATGTTATNILGLY